ncbi:MAG: hypothetical protein OXE95_10205 [Chloroflexi bacterium]|nr:hypothetical protein [Chloroflexota bacterium]MCY4247931.1 hypothetical protein [Chloroflexota bacterium]
MNYDQLWRQLKEKFDELDWIWNGDEWHWEEMVRFTALGEAGLDRYIVFHMERADYHNDRCNHHEEREAYLKSLGSHDHAAEIEYHVNCQENHNKSVEWHSTMLNLAVAYKLVKKSQTPAQK